MVEERGLRINTGLTLVSQVNDSSEDTDHKINNRPKGKLEKQNPHRLEVKFPLYFVHVNAHTATLCKVQTISSSEVFFYWQSQQENSNKAQRANADLAVTWFLA